MLNWEAIGAVGEILGAIAVVATDGRYLADQSWFEAGVEKIQTLPGPDFK